MALILSTANSLLSRLTTKNAIQAQAKRNWTDFRMRKDHKKRQMVVQQADIRLRLNTLKKNDVLPREIREIADQQMSALDHNGSAIRIVYRCTLTSRPRGVVIKYGLSRIMWRHFADYNKMCGVQRAMW